MHDGLEKRIPVGKFGPSEELLDVALQEDVRGNQIG
jgi:hypothetical protein